MSLRHLDSLFHPKSIAFIGASQEPGRIGTMVTRNLLHGGFDGPIMPVTRRFKSVGGVLAYPSLAELPMTPELAIIGTPRAKGIGFSHFIALGECADVGFAEVIDFLSMEPSTRAILLFMKTLVHSRGFISAARAAARNKPVLIVKATGRPEATAIGSVQTRARVRSDAVYAAAFRRAGMLQVQDTGAVRGGGNPGPLGSAQE